MAGPSLQIFLRVEVDNSSDVLRFGPLGKFWKSPSPGGGGGHSSLHS
jgi:hypothetical protein